MRPLGWVLMQSNQCPYQKRTCRQTLEMHMWRQKRPFETTAKRWPSANGLRWPSASQEKASRETKLGYTLISDFSVLQPRENKFLLFKPSCLWDFVPAALTKENNHYTIETVIYNYIHSPVYPAEFQRNQISHKSLISPTVCPVLCF